MRERSRLVWRDEGRENQNNGVMRCECDRSFIAPAMVTDRYQPLMR